jgi:hypothetical protein
MAASIGTASLACARLGVGFKRCIATESLGWQKSYT